MSDFEILSIMLAMMTIIVTILISWIKDRNAKK